MQSPKSIHYNPKQTQEWIDSLKIALLEQNEDKIYELTQNLPFFMEKENNSQDNINEEINPNSQNSKQKTASKDENVDEELYEYLQISAELISQSIEILKSKKNETLNQIDKIKKAKKFLL